MGIRHNIDKKKGVGFACWYGWVTAQDFQCLRTQTELYKKNLEFPKAKPGKPPRPRMRMIELPSKDPGDPMEATRIVPRCAA